MANKTLYVSQETEEKIERLNEIINGKSNLSQAVAIGIDKVIKMLEEATETEREGYIIALRR